MGKIQTKELANGNLQVEITYGGFESPFGGVDKSAPPAYIDPRCAVSVDNTLIVNNKLCSIAANNFTIPTLWASVAGVSLLGMGTFYETGYGQLNYAIGYIAQEFGIAGVSPTGVNYTFYMTTWKPNTPSIVLSDTSLELTLFDSYLPASQASISLDCIGTGAQSNPAASSAIINILAVHDYPPTYGWITSNSDLSISGGAGYAAGQFITIVQGSNYGAVVQILTVDGSGAILTWNLTGPASGYTVGPATSVIYVDTPTVLKIIGPGGTHTYSVGSSTWATLTRAAVVSAMVTAINSGPDPNVVAAASLDGNSIVLTAINAGIAGNSITVQDLSSDYSGTLPPIFYFAPRTADNLSGGTALSSVIAPRSFGKASIADVGGTLYIANLGPIILKYTEPASLKPSTMYQGVDVLRKFAGSLLGLRVQPQLGTLVQNSDMIMAWSAAGNLDEWAPVTTAGLVTGAGFEQLADVGDSLTGLIVSNGTVFILRAQGVSYATATGNATLPYSLNHIALGDRGEGAQIDALISQYDSVGCYIGNSDVWQCTGTITAIGSKIKQAIFNDLQNQSLTVNQLASGAGSVFIGGNEFPIAVFAIGKTVYIFNTSNGTWTTLNLNLTSDLTQRLCSPLVGISTNGYEQSVMGIIIQNTIAGVPQAPVALALTEQLPNNFLVFNTMSIIFPQEEILFGRDVTIDALYIALQAQFQSDTVLDVYLNDILYASYALQATSFTDINANPIELQIFPATATGVNTGHSPQLTLQFINNTALETNIVRLTKATMFGSIDANQRPV